MIPSLQTLWQKAHDSPDHVFLDAPAFAITYRDLIARIGAELHRFDSAGLRHGDRLLIRSADETAAIVLFLAALLDGLVPVMLAPGTPDERMTAIAASVEPGLICEAASPDQRSADRAPRLPGAPDDLAYILFTSGTTQSPSGVAPAVALRPRAPRGSPRSAS